MDSNVAEALKKRLDYIINKREAGMSYETIARSLARNGHGKNLSKQRVKEIIEAHRPDLLGSVKGRQPWRKDS